MINTDIVVSVCIITYKHELFIAQTIESILSQKFTFRYEIVIGEDASSDNTRKICEEYALKYSDIIRLLPSDKNYGAVHNFERTLAACKGKFIALCEGDDYWVDEFKLQKQVDLLDANPDKILCFTKSYCIDGDGKMLGDNVVIPIQDVYSFKDVINMDRFYIPTATILFRNVLDNPLPAFLTNSISGDIALCLFLLDYGDALCIHEEMAVYRKHAGGITMSAYHLNNSNILLFKLYEQVREYYHDKYKNVINARLFEMSKTILIYGSKDKKGLIKLRYALKYFPLYFRYQPSYNLKEIIYITSILFFPFLLKFKA